MKASPMTLKLLALALLVGAGVLIHAQGNKRVPHGPADDVALLPAQIGDYQQSARRWYNPQHGGIVEEGAIYTANAAPGKSLVPVQLDYYRHARGVHNGLGCYLIQGETLHWQRRQSVATAAGNTVFLLGLTQTREQVRLVAATECSARQCVGETPVGSNWSFLNLGATLFGDAAGSNDVVPVSVVLTAQDDGNDIAATQAALLEQFRRFAASLDMSGASRVAALQGGHAKS
jgi:hypothetical protein